VLSGGDRLQGDSRVNRGDGQIYDQLDIGHSQHGGQVPGAGNPVFIGLAPGAILIDVRAGKDFEVGEADEI
jgi:hypothetical protein